MNMSQPISDPKAGGMTGWQIVVAAARDLVGTPFRHQGRTVNGIDCIGLLALSFRAAGMEVKDRTDYGRTPARRKLAAALVEQFGPPTLFSPVKVEQLQPGDVVAMAWGDEEAHVGLVADYLYGGVSLIHALKEKQKTVEHRLDQVVADRITLVFRPEFGA